MQKNCLQCQSAFEVTDDDLKFLDQVSPMFAGKKELIPPPTLCPDCRNQRRMCWRNDRTFCLRTCDLTGERFVSLYPQRSPYTVYKPSAWYGEGWDPLSYGRPFDLSRSFFEQLRELQLKVPRLGIDVVNCENSDYCNYCGDDKDCYLDIAGEANQNCYYNLFIKFSKDCTDCTFVYTSTMCYEAINCYNSYNVRYSQYLDNCSDCSFCFDCKGCRNCIFCVNLRNKEYHILNEPHTKEEYERKLAELQLGSHVAVQSANDLWRKMRVEKGIYRDMYNLNCEDCIGNDVKNSKRCRNVFNVVNCEDSKYLNDVLDAKDCQDLNYSLYKPELAYELISTLQMRSSACNMASHYCSSVYYCDLTNNSQNLFGCIGLNHKQYCILNKQYSKEEYEELVPKIIKHMRKNGGNGGAMNRTSEASSGSWGEFFPVALSPFAYNETVAQEYFPLTKDEVLKRGWQWREEKEEMPKVSKVIPASQLPDSVDDIPDDILNWAIQCEATKRPFKIIKQELDFYRKMKLPVSHFHPDERHRRRMALRNPRKLWKRPCMKCGKEMQTTYPPSRPEIVYCETCYLAEVY